MRVTKPHRRDELVVTLAKIAERQEVQVHRFEKRLTVVAMGLIAALVCTLTPVRTYAQQKEKKVKDQGEYDLFNAYTKETDPAKKLQYLNQWVEKYPESDYQEEQLRFYSDLNQPAKVMEMGAKLLAKDPKNFVALSLITDNIRRLP